MKIIRQGILPEPITYRATCHYCKTEVAYERKEVTPSIDRRCDPYVLCPLCRGPIFCRFERA